MQPSVRTASSSTRPGASPLPRQASVQGVNTQTKVIDTVAGRILCIADIRGRLSGLNELAKEANAKAIIHAGDFGFFESSSLDRINDRTLRHLTMYSPLVPSAQRTTLLANENPSAIRSAMNISLLSEFPLLLSGQLKLHVPVFAVWGACEDVHVLEKFRQGTYDIENLHVLDEATTRCLDIGGVKLRLLGLGGAFVPHKMFDNGDGNATIAGGQGTMWTTALQIGELVDTAQRVFDPTETRLLITHASPGREGIMAQLALVLKADLTMSAGLHFRYASSYNEFSVQADFEGYRRKILTGKEAFDKVWESVKTQVDALLDDGQRILLEKALSVTERVPNAQNNLGPGATATGDEPAWKNCWNWNLCDAAYGSLVLDVKEGRISAELKSQGFNYAYRRTASPSATAPTPKSTTSTLPTNAAAPTTGPASPAPAKAADLMSNSQSPAVTSPNGQATPAQPHTPKLNGAATPGDKTEKFKKDRRKDKKDSPKQDQDAKKDGAAPSEGPEASSEAKAALESSAPQSGKATPAISEWRDNRTAAQEGDPTPQSPTGGTESTGVRTPTSKRSPRNPWTLFVRMPNPANESELREFFGEAKSGITRIHMPNPVPNKPRIAYVEFGDEEAMRAGLSQHAEKLNDAIPYVTQSEDREHRENRDHSGGFRGRGRGRGGGFAARGFAAAGLTRGGFERRGGHHNANGDANTSRPAPNSDAKKEGNA